METEFNARIAEWQSGDPGAGDEVFRVVQEELRSIAAARLRQERNSSMSSGDLVNEAVLRLSRLQRLELQSRSHLLALASRIMRQTLVDAARRKNTNKRMHQQVTLNTEIIDSHVPRDLIALDTALIELQDVAPDRAQIVELRFFGGLTNADIATVLGVSEPTVKRRWASTKAWLVDRLSA